MDLLRIKMKTELRKCIGFVSIVIFDPIELTRSIVLKYNDWTPGNADSIANALGIDIAGLSSMLIIGRIELLRLDAWS